jgi:UDP-glucose 4-epimerase
MKKCLVTGAAGFIGSNMVDALLSQGHCVVGYDNFSTGHRKFLQEALACPRFSLIEGDILNDNQLRHALSDCDTVFHFAANADVRFGLNHPERDLEQNTVGTFRVLESMRATGVKSILFSSTGSVYGEAKQIPTPEDALFPVQTSLYGASKLAGEGLIAAYAEGFGLSATIFRFVSFLGQRYTHGHVVDFVKQLQEHPEYLNVLGNGTQTKSYLDVADGVAAMLEVWAAHHGQGVRLYNLGTEETCTVRDSIAWIAEALKIKPEIRYGEGNRGWVGDNPLIFLDTTKIRGTGWKAHYSIRDGINRTVRWLSENPWAITS